MPAPSGHFTLSLHRPVAVVEGSRTLNRKMSVRLGTESPLDEDCEVRRGDPLERHSGEGLATDNQFSSTYGQPVFVDPRRDAECAV